jgi:hypothetical protein
LIVASVTPVGVFKFLLLIVTRSFASLRSGLYSVVPAALGSRLRGGIAVVPSCMRTLLAICAASLLATGLIVSPTFGDKPGDQSTNERAVFVTGSLIPQRIKLKRIGTATTSPVRIIDRQEIDATGRQTTRGALVADPSVRIIDR